MQALILAAGLGKRLGDSADGRPKCLVEVGGRSLIEHQLETFADAGIGPVTVVVGHKADEVRNVVGNRAQYVVNDDPEGTNSLYSFLLARGALKGPAVVANCDLLFHPSILDRLLDVRGSALAYDSTFGPGREKMKVALHDGNVADMGKDLPYGQATGENVGLILLREDALNAVMNQAELLLKAGRRKAWLAEAVKAAAAEVPIRGVDVAGLPWIEIDFPFDLHAARKRVWPDIQRDRWKRTVRWHRTRWAVAVLALAALAGGSAAIGHRMAAPAEEWDSIRLADLPEAMIGHPDGTTSRWWTVKRGETARTSVEGPPLFRVEVRPILTQAEAEQAKEDPERFLFVIEILLDGASRKLEAYRFEEDPEAKHETYRVGARKRVELRLDPGPHTVSVRCVTGKAETLLVRFREPVRVEKD